MMFDNFVIKILREKYLYEKMHIVIVNFIGAPWVQSEVFTTINVYISYV